MSEKSKYPPEPDSTRKGGHSFGNGLSYYFSANNGINLNKSVTFQNMKKKAEKAMEDHAMKD